jgi:hypothetical protein
MKRIGILLLKLLSNKKGIIPSKIENDMVLERLLSEKSAANPLVLEQGLIAYRFYQEKKENKTSEARELYAFISVTLVERKGSL